MKQNNSLGNPIIIEIVYEIGEVLSKNVSFEWKTSEPKEHFVNYGNDNSSIEDLAIDEMAKLVQTGQVRDIEKIAREYSGAFSIILSKLTRKAYNKDKMNFYSGSDILEKFAKQFMLKWNNGHLDSPEQIFLAFQVRKIPKNLE